MSCEEKASTGIFQVFEELLLDADWSVNAGMWLWLSCSSFFQQFFHCYCPVKFGRKADPNGDYIRKYVPVLKNFPTKYIHEPVSAFNSLSNACGDTIFSSGLQTKQCRRIQSASLGKTIHWQW
jgi:deoxyribodipyrimidine photolyase